MSVLLKNKYDEDIYEFFKTNYIKEEQVATFTNEFKTWEEFRVKLENKSQPKAETQEDEDEEEVEAEETEKEADWWTILNLDYQFSDSWDPTKVLASYYIKDQEKQEDQNKEE